MLNWETYKTLNSKQKEEYNFRFKNREDLNIRGLASNASILFLCIIVTVFILYLSFTVPEFEQYKGSIALLMKSCLFLGFSILILILGYITGALLWVNILRE
jgi:hypothetical protein